MNTSVMVAFTMFYSTTPNPFMDSSLYHILGVLVLGILAFVTICFSLPPFVTTSNGFHLEGWNMGLWALRCWRSVPAAVYFADESADGSNRGLDGVN